jgi:hypothetical protein
VGGVEHDRGAPADDLEPARRGDLLEGGPHEVAVQRVLADEGLDGCQRDGGVLPLVGSVERQEHLVVLGAQALQPQQLAPDGRHPLGDSEVPALDVHGGPHLGGTLGDHRGHLLALGRAHHP